MERFLFEHMPTELQAAHVALFHHVENAGAVRQRLISASKMPPGPDGDQEREAVEFAWLDADKISSLTHLLTAVHAALLAAAQGQLKAQTCHSEILYQLTPSTNIADGLKQFGLGPSTKNLLVVKCTSPHTPLDATLRHLQSLVQGRLGSLQNLGASSDVAALTKIYKLSAEEAASQKAGNEKGAILRKLAPSIVVAGLST